MAIFNIKTVSCQTIGYVFTVKENKRNPDALYKGISDNLTLEYVRKYLEQHCFRRY